MSVSVIIPCYRSEKTLPILVSRLDEVMRSVTNEFEVVLVVDGSPDRTWEVAAELAKSCATVRAIQLARNYGQHNAIIAGIRAARFDVLVTMDDDLQHPPEEVPKLLAAFDDDIDVVYGISVAEEHNLGRNVASRLIKFGLSVGLNVNDAKKLSAFRAFRAFLRNGFDNISGPLLSIDVALSWTTTKIVAVEVEMAKRTQGKSGYTFKKLVNLAIDVALGYSVAPLRIVTYFGVLVGLGALGLLVRLLWLYFSGDTTVAGFTTVASMIAIFSSAQLIAIGVLGEYLARLHTRGMGRPTYVVRDRVDGPATAALNAAHGQIETISGEHQDGSGLPRITAQKLGSSAQPQ